MSLYDDDDTLNLYKKLFRVISRSFYDPVAIVIVDYMVFKNRGSMTEDEIEQTLRIPKKRVRESFTKMKMDEVIKNNIDEARWTLNSDIRQILKARIEFLFGKINQKKESPKYKCPQCGKEIEQMMMALCKGMCQTCNKPFESKESENRDTALVKEALNKIKLIIHTLEQGKREFDSRIYGEEYQKFIEKNLERQNQPDPNHRPRHLRHTGSSYRHSNHAIVDIKNEGHVLAFVSEPLYKKALRKLEEKNKELKTHDNVLKESRELKEYYARNPSSLHKSRKTFDKLLKKRKRFARLNDVEYAKEYRSYITKRLLI